MESLALPCLNSFTSSRASFHKEQSNKLLAKARYLNSSKPASLRLTPYYIAPSFVRIYSIYSLFWLMGSHYFLCSLFLLSLFVPRENQGKWGERKLRLVVFCFFSMFFFLKNLGGIRMQAGGEEYELKQMRDMAAAKKRWDALVFRFI